MMKTLRRFPYSRRSNLYTGHLLSKHVCFHRQSSLKRLKHRNRHWIAKSLFVSDRLFRRNIKILRQLLLHILNLALNALLDIILSLPPRVQNPPNRIRNGVFVTHRVLKLEGVQL